MNDNEMHKMSYGGWNRAMMVTMSHEVIKAKLNKINEQLNGHYDDTN